MKTTIVVNCVLALISALPRVTCVDSCRSCPTVIREIKDLVIAIKNPLEATTARNETYGAVYVRWGRTNCTEGSVLIYSGLAAGGYYNGGGAANSLCLPKNPRWRKYKDGNQTAGVIYGAQYDFLYSTGETIDTSHRHHDVPCVVCQSIGRLILLMVPGRDICNDGWHMEYNGYLMSDRASHKLASEYLCVDKDIEVLNHGEAADKPGRLFSGVEAQCGILPCPPYVEGRELTCAVCTR